MNTIVGIDPSITNLGLARITECPAGFLAETWSRPATGKLHASVAEENDRIVHLAADAISFCLPCDIAVIEGPSMHSRGGKPWERAGLWWRIVSRLLNHDVLVIPIAPTSRAKWATDNGRSDKAAVSAAMARMWPDVLIQNSDQADALALASIGLQIHDPISAPFPLPQYRIEALTKALAKVRLPEHLERAA